jgi:hypothetical protein
LQSNLPRGTFFASLAVENNPEKRERFGIARGTVEKLLRDIGIKGVLCGKKIKTT